MHFAEGPGLSELGLDTRGEKVGGSGDVGGERKEVISGMRRDAQLLVYVDVRAALEGEGERGMEWWRSENGVVLTEGVEVEVEGERSQGGDVVGDVQDAGQGGGDGAGVDVDVNVDTPTLPDHTKDQHPHDRKPKPKPHQQGKSKRAQTAAQADKLVPMKYWTVVVDVKGGRGVIWRQGEGMVKELPEELTRMGTPKGRGRGGGRGGGRGRGR